MDTAFLKNTKVSIVGAARSGIAAAMLLKSAGAVVFVSDSARADRLQSSIADLRSKSIEFEVGGHSDRVYDCRLLVVSPGVPSDAPVIREAQKRSIKIVGELEISSWFCRSPIVAVTGSNGKTTTTTLIGRMLDDAKKKHIVAGNIGTAFSSVVLALAETDFAVLEVSSFQLDHIDAFRPNISALLNITPDHLDRYDHSMDKYAASKARIFGNQRPDDTLIFNADDEWTLNVVSKARCRTVGFSVKQALAEGACVENGSLVTRLNGSRTEIIGTGEIFIKGMHNLYNAMAAALVGHYCGLGPASMRSTLISFKGVEHRLEFVRELDRVKYYNDSKGTNVDSVWYALQSFREPIVLILGGRDKGNDYSRLLPLVRDRVKAIIAIGESADKVEQSFIGTTSIAKASSMDEAVSKARSLAQPGAVVLLSPACASFDWFNNYEHRGRVFKECVNKL
jgi:UDP-N-acetylmuramoylalanine--D-glutamate ligase